MRFHADSGNRPEAIRHEREMSNAGRKKMDFTERDKCKPVLLRLSLAGNLEKHVSLWERMEQCCGSGSGIQVLGSGAFLTHGSGIRDRFFPDPGSRISDPKSIFLRAW
jgi:hypothetical protein